MLEFLPKKDRPDDTIFLSKKDREKLRRAIEDLIREQPHLTIKEIGEGSIGESTLRRLLNSQAVRTLMLESERRQLRDFFHEATHIAFDSGAVRQFIGALGERYEIPIREIARLCGIIRKRLKNFVAREYKVRFMKLQEGRALWELPERLEREDVEFSERYYRPLSDSESRSNLDKKQLRQFIDAIRTKFHIAIFTIAKECGIDRAQLFNLLTPKGRNWISTKVAQALWELPERLEERSSPIDRGFRRVIEPDEMAGKVELDKSQLDQFINALCEKFQGLTIENIEKLCGMHHSRLRALLRTKQWRGCVYSFIRPAEMAALWNLPERLSQGEVTYTPSLVARGVKKFKLDQQNFHQYIDFLLETFDGLTIGEIERMCGFPMYAFHALRNASDRLMADITAQALWDLPQRIQRGEVTYTVKRNARKLSEKRTRIHFEKEPVHQLVDAIAERYGVTRAAVGRALGFTASRFEDIMYRRRHNLFRREAEALWNLPDKIEQGEIDIREFS